MGRDDPDRHRARRAPISTDRATLDGTLLDRVLPTPSERSAALAVDLALVGAFADRGASRSLMTMVGVMLVGNAAIFVKLFLAACLLPGGWALLRLLDRTTARS